jgi:hypothetical protein
MEGFVVVDKNCYVHLIAYLYFFCIIILTFRDQWPFEKVPCDALGLRELYIHRHTEIHQMKFGDPVSALYYLDPAETTPSHLMLHRKSIWFCQVS